MKPFNMSGEAELMDAPPRLPFVGPPAPRALTWLTRIFELLCLFIVVLWIFAHLGGLALSTTEVSETTNDTSRIFNWHPLLMTIAFPLLMAEAVLAYKVPIVSGLDRPQRKILHASFHTTAVICMIGALIAVFQSHNLQKPAPIPNLYSPHSYMGVFTFSLALLQYFLGLYAYLFPKLTLRQRVALSPVHAFLGKTTFIAGLATMTAGIQEKTSFILNKPGLDKYAPVVRIPATLEVMLILTGMLVLYHHQPPAGGHRRRDADLDNLLAETAD